MFVLVGEVTGEAVTRPGRGALGGAVEDEDGVQADGLLVVPRG
jgi:hypothetical protein